MRYQLLDNTAQPIDAHFEVDDGEILFLSRGGSRAHPSASNTEYGHGLRLVLARLVEANLPIASVVVDTASKIVQGIPEEDRRVLSEAEAWPDVNEMYSRITNRMKDVGRDPSAKPGGGNSTKRIRLRFTKNVPNGELVRLLTGQPSEDSFLKNDRIPAQDLRRVKPQHVWRAMEKMLSGEREDVFGDPTGYVVASDDGTRLPPEEVFGIAATEALGFTVLPKHFSGGEETICFEVLRAAGYDVQPLGEERIGEERNSTPTPSPPEDQEWSEGNPKLVTHYVRERKRGLSRAKKASFIEQHGHLYCENCGFLPSEKYGDAGDACIEVHHASVAVADMEPEHVTSLEELQCLCANCHRVEHYRMRSER